MTRRVHGRDTELTLVAAMGLSYVGTATTSMVLPVIAVTMLQGGPISVGLLSASTGLPGIVLRVPIGALADRASARLAILIVADAARLLLLAAVPLLWWVKALGLEAVVGIGLAIGVFSVLHAAFMPTVVPTLFPRARWSRMNGQLAAAEAVGDAVGPLLGAGLLRVVAAPVALLLDGGTYAVSLAAKARIVAKQGWRPSVAPSPEPTPPPPTPHEVGCAPVPVPTRLPGVLVPIAAGNGVVGALLLLILRASGHGTTSYGLVLAMAGIGAFVGGAVSGPLIGRLGPARTTVAAALCMAMGTALVPFVLVPPHLTVLAAVGETIGGAGGVVLVVSIISQIQMSGERVGATVAQVMLLVEVGQVTGALVGGVIAHALGVHWAAWAALAFAAAGAAVAAYRPGRALV